MVKGITEIIEDFKVLHPRAYEKIYNTGKSDALNIDMDEPMHFTDKQKAWIKNYIITNAKRQRADAIDEFWKEFDKQIKLKGKQTHYFTEFLTLGMEIRDRLKEQK